MPLNRRSAVTPAWNGTISVTGLDGKASGDLAEAGVRKPTRAPTAINAESNKRQRIVLSSLDLARFGLPALDQWPTLFVLFRACDCHPSVCDNHTADCRQRSIFGRRASAFHLGDHLGAEALDPGNTLLGRATT